MWQKLDCGIMEKFRFSPKKTSTKFRRLAKFRFLLKVRFFIKSSFTTANIRAIPYGPYGTRL